MIRRAMGLGKVTLAAGAALTLFAACATAPPPATPPETAAPTVAASAGLTILQVNDTYKIEGLRGGREGGMGRVRALRRELEAAGRQVLVLHAGDFLFPSVMSKYLLGAPMVDALSFLDGARGQLRLDGSRDAPGYEGTADFDERLFVTFGNHEFDNPDPQVLYDRIAQSRFNWVSSNIRARPAPDAEPRPLGERFPNVLDHAVVEAGGIRVGIFGLTLDDQRRPWLEYGFDEAPRRATIARVLDALEREGAEFVVALTHQNIGDDEWLAREFGSRIDWIAGGHEHVYLRRTVGETVITKADADALTVLRIDVERRDGRVIARDDKLVLDESRQVDPDMAGEVALSLVRLARAVWETTGRGLLEIVATTEHLLEGTEPAIRGRETALGDFLCDALRARFAADIALVNGGAIRVNDDVPAGGDLRVYELEGIFYYDDRPVIVEIAGRDLVAVLERSVSEAELGHGRFLQVSGVRFRYRTRTGGPPTVDPADVSVAEGGGDRFAPLELDRAYRVATLTYLWKYGYRDGYPLFSLGDGGTSPRLLESPEISWRALTEEAIARLPDRRIVTKIDGRIEKID